MSAVEPAHGSHRTEILLMVVATLLALAGILIAWLFYGRERAPGAVRRKPGYVHALVDRGYFFDDFYDRVIVRGAAWVSDSILVPVFESPLAKATLTRSAEATLRLDVVCTAAERQRPGVCLLRAGGSRDRAVVGCRPCLNPGRCC